MKWNKIKHSKEKSKQSLIHYLEKAGWKNLQNVKKKIYLSSVQCLDYILKKQTHLLEKSVEKDWIRLKLN